MPAVKSCRSSPVSSGADVERLCSRLGLTVFCAGLKSKYEEALNQGERLEGICKSRKNKDYVALDNPSAHVSLHQVTSCQDFARTSVSTSPTVKIWSCVLQAFQKMQASHFAQRAMSRKALARQYS